MAKNPQSVERYFLKLLKEEENQERMDNILKGLKNLIDPPAAHIVSCYIEKFYPNTPIKKVPDEDYELISQKVHDLIFKEIKKKYGYNYKVKHLLNKNEQEY